MIPEHTVHHHRISNLTLIIRIIRQRPEPTPTTRIQNHRTNPITTTNPRDHTTNKPATTSNNNLHPTPHTQHRHTPPKMPKPTDNKPQRHHTPPYSIHDPTKPPPPNTKTPKHIVRQPTTTHKHPPPTHKRNATNHQRNATNHHHLDRATPHKADTLNPDPESPRRRSTSDAVETLGRVPAQRRRAAPNHAPDTRPHVETRTPGSTTRPHKTDWARRHSDSVGVGAQQVQGRGAFGVPGPGRPDRVRAGDSGRAAGGRPATRRSPSGRARRFRPRAPGLRAVGSHCARPAHRGALSRDAPAWQAGRGPRRHSPSTCAGCSGSG